MRHLAGIALFLASTALAAQVRSASMGAMRSGPGAASAASLPTTSLAMTSTSGHSLASPGIGLNRPHTGIVGSFGVHPDHHRNHFPLFRRSLFDNGLFDRGLFDGAFFGAEPVLVNQQPEPVIIEVAPPVQQVVEDPKPGAPLLIEWQGDRFVRLNTADVNSVGRPQDYSEAASLKKQPRHPQSPTRARRNSSTKYQLSHNTSTESQPQRVPAILVFCDGRQLSVDSYSIIGSVLYQSAGYWTDGYWAKKIELADLDLPTTVRLNRDRGIKFLLPSAPNQIITRP